MAINDITGTVVDAAMLGYRIDLLVEESVVVELRTVTKLRPVA